MDLMSQILSSMIENAENFSVRNQASLAGSRSATNTVNSNSTIDLLALTQYLATNQERIASLETEVKHIMGINERIVSIESDIKHLERDLKEEKANIEKILKENKEAKMFKITTGISVIALLVSIAGLFFKFS